MKALILLLISAILYSNAQQIKLYTTSSEKIYNLFPLTTNYIEFKVKANHNVHIALTPTYFFGSMYYEILLGGWGNTRSVIRKDDDYNVVAEHKGYVVEQDSFATYWVKINDAEGSISAGKGKKAQPLLRFVDRNYVKMGYFGLSTGFGSSGIWIINSTKLLNCGLQTKQTPIERNLIHSDFVRSGE